MLTLVRVCRVARGARCWSVQSSCASGGLKPWLRSGKPCGLDQPRSPWLWQGYLKRQPRRGFHALREGLSPHERRHVRRRTTSDCFSCRLKFISVAVWGARFWECSTLSIRFNLCGNCYKFLLNGEEPLTCILCELSLQLTTLLPCGATRRSHR